MKDRKHSFVIGNRGGYRGGGGRTFAPPEISE